MNPNRMAMFIVVQLVATIGAIVVVYALDWDFKFAGEAIGLASVAFLVIWTKLVNMRATKREQPGAETSAT